MSWRVSLLDIAINDHCEFDNPQDFDAHPSFIQPTALQPGAIVAYKLDTRMKDVWVLTVALNSCPTLGKSHKKSHHLQLQTLQTIKKSVFLGVLLPNYNLNLRRM